MLNKISGIGHVNFVGETNMVNKKGQQSSTQNQTYGLSQLQTLPLSTLQAYSPNLNFGGKLDVKFINAPNIQELSDKYGEQMKSDIQNFQDRIGLKGQFLNWPLLLPGDQLKRIDEIYETADGLKQNGNGKLGVIGIGGSRHTAENILTLNGIEDKVAFLSATDPDSIRKFIKKLGNLDTANILVVSKSGTTLEPSVGYQEVEKIFIDSYKEKYQKAGLSQEDAQKAAERQASKHFVGITDANPATSKLRNIVNEKGYKSGIIHDDCGGRFGAFDDHSLVSLAYAGMPKDKMKAMLEASIKAQKKYLSPDLSKNIAAQRAMFNVDSIEKGKTNQFDYFFGDIFEGTPLWNIQLKRESHKAKYFASGDSVGPAFLHYAAESDLDAANKTSFYTFTTLGNKGSKEYKPYNAIVEGVIQAYSGMHPVSEIKMKDLSPEAIAEYIELKHFETVYTGMLLRSANGEAHPEVLPEVLQPNVEIYKKEVKKAMQKMDE